MDLDLLKTFLEVRRTRHFGQAAENLFLTQAAVSARIKQLERMLAAPLFTRYRNNLQLTPMGERLVGHAEAMLQAWDSARQDLDPRKDLRQSMEVGGTRAAWELLPKDRLPLLFDEVGHLLLRLVSHREETLV
jgi:LysR family transcriptional regulator, flagellar master operon regulator